MKKGIVVRRAKLDDIHGMCQLLKILFSIEEDFKFNDEKQVNGLKMMLQDKDKNCIFVAQFGKEIVGMISGQCLISTAEGGISVLVEDVVVKSNYRNNKIGEKLLLNMEEWARSKGAKRCQLLADKDNFNAIEFYKYFNWINTNLVCLKKI